MRLHALAHSRAAPHSTKQRSGVRVLQCAPAQCLPLELRGVGFGACESAVAVQLGEREGTGRAQHTEPPSASALAVAAESRLKPSSSRRESAVLSLSGLSAPSLGSSVIAAHPPSSSLPKLNESSSGPPADASGSSPTRAQLSTRIRGCDGTGNPCDMRAYCDIGSARAAWLPVRYAAGDGAAAAVCADSDVDVVFVSNHAESSFAEGVHWSLLSSGNGCARARESPAPLPACITPPSEVG